MSRTRLLCAVAVAAVAVAVPVASGTAARSTTSVLPTQLVGSWTRNFTAAGWRKAGAPDFEFFTGPYTMVVLRSGKVTVASFNVQFKTLSDSRLSIAGLTDCGSYSAGLYRWKVASRRLTITKLKDSCPPDVGLFVGVWKRK